MKFNRKLYFVIITLGVLWIHCAFSQGNSKTNSDWIWINKINSLSQTQKLNLLKRLETQRAELAKPHLVGLIDLRGQGTNPARECWVGAEGFTNLTAYKPLPAQAFEARLFDDDGKQLSKTFYGRQFGKPLKPDKKLLDGTFKNDRGERWGRSRELLFSTGDGHGHFWDFDILKAFHIKEIGEYRLQVEVRLFTKDTNGAFQPLILPPVETKVKITVNDID